jgi:hypothetical protein
MKPNLSVQVQERNSSRLTSTFSLKDTIIDVVNHIRRVDQKPSACFVDSVLVDPNTMVWLNPKAIKGIHVDKNEITIDGKRYFGQIFFTTSDSISVNLMSLSEIRRKYTNTNSRNCFYVLTDPLSKNKVIVTDNANTKVDRNYIFRIIIDQLSLGDDHEQESSKVDVIKILFRTQENIDDANKIIIR